MEYIGTDKSILDKIASGFSGCEGDFMADAMENGKIVWRKVRKKRKRFPA
jgi:uncharacterized protein (DUF2249 family)